MTLTKAVTAELEKELDPALVSHREGSGRRQVPYLEGYVAIDQANQIFGYGSWGYELVGPVQLHELEVWNKKDNRTETKLAYSATVRVTVDKVPSRTDVGFCTVRSKTVDGHETAIKGAVTDGMKRALRAFGARFGNDLYGPGSPPASSNGNGHHPPYTNGTGPAGGSGVDKAATEVLQEINRQGTERLGKEAWFGQRIKGAATWASEGRTDQIAQLTPAEAGQVLAKLQGEPAKEVA